MRIKLKNAIEVHLLLIFFLSFYFIVISFTLITHPTPFYDWDESINVQVSKEIIENKSLVPLWQGNPWFDKPPLPFLFFGIIMKLTPFIQPEISLRITALFLSLLALVFIYSVFLKAVKQKLIAFLAVVITAFTPIFLQRSQIVNLDVFLIIGWLGYILFVQNFWLSLFFLTVGVLSKSLLGFYPTGIMLAYYSLLFLKPLRLNSNQEMGKPQRLIKQILIQVGILSFWYVIMLVIFGKDFWQQHIVETHFRRVTASIESHFGQRTYYIDLIREQLGWFFGVSVIGFSLIVWRFLNRQLTTDRLMYSLFLFPWFIFLNLTKTKIFWYIYPAIPQFAFLSVYPLTLLKNKKVILYLVSCILIFYVINNNFIKTNFFTTFYSKPEDYYHLALYARNHCDSLTVLVGKETREAIKTLEDLELTISSTKQWGDHPSMVYYFSKDVAFYYHENLLIKNLLSFPDYRCLAIREDDLDLVTKNKQFVKLKNFNSYYLFKQ